MAEILDKTFLDLQGLTNYDDKLKQHLTDTATGTSNYVDVGLTLSGKHTSTGKYISGLTVDTTKLQTALNAKANKNIKTVSVKNSSNTVKGSVTVKTLDDTIVLKDGANISMTADDASKTITIAASMNFSSLDSTVSDDGTYVGVQVVETDGKLTSVSVDEAKLSNKISTLDGAINKINQTLVGGVHFIGVVTAIPTSASVTIDGKTVTAQKGDIVLYKYVNGEDSANPNSTQDTGLEFIYTGTAWEELGSPDKCSKWIDAVEATVSGISGKVTPLEANQVVAVKQTTTDSCGTDLTTGALPNDIDTNISHSATDRGYIYPLFRDKNKKGFVHIKAIPDASINALFA